MMIIENQRLILQLTKNLKFYRIRLYDCLRFLSVGINLREQEIVKWFGAIECWNRIQAAALPHMLKSYFTVCGSLIDKKD